MELFGERVAGRLPERPCGGAGGVVPERERGLEVLGLDVALSVEQRVEEREADRVRFGAGREGAGEAVAGLGELRVGVPPQLAGGVIECELSGGLGVFEDGGEVAEQAGVLERVGVAALWQQPHPSDRGEHEAVHEAVGDLDGGGVAGELGLGDVADDRDMRAGGGRGRGPGQQRQRPAVPRGPECRGERRDLSGCGFQNGREFGFDDEQPFVVRAGVLVLGVTDGPDQTLAT